MAHPRLTAHVLPELVGPVVVLGWRGDSLPSLEIPNIIFVSQSAQLHSALSQRGYSVTRDLPQRAGTVIIMAARAKAETRQALDHALQICPDGLIVVDGQKTDGIDSTAKLLKSMGFSVQSHAKAHGKVLWLYANGMQTLPAPPQYPAQTTGHWHTAPGVFSADGVDPASELLARNLPDTLPPNIADLGAGWGYLAAQALAKMPSAGQIHLVEDNAAALDCARLNVTDPRAHFHWADALAWQSPQKFDAILMNPPFHQGRNANPELGQNFIRAAAKLLHAKGVLWMVANAQLPYEDTLSACFATHTRITRDSRFKVIRADNPKS